jgi:hypothetical protein
MKKLTLKIPEWRGERPIYILFGREAFATVDINDKIHIKTVRCTYCGLCCQEPGPQFPEYIPEGETKKYCAHCEKDADGVWYCTNGAVPYGCIKENANRLPHKDCPIKYKVE